MDASGCITHPNVPFIIVTTFRGDNKQPTACVVIIRLGGDIRRSLIFLLQITMQTTPQAHK